jgi:hypothetical protein
VFPLLLDAIQLSFIVRFAGSVHVLSVALSVHALVLVLFNIARIPTQVFVPTELQRRAVDDLLIPLRICNLKDRVSLGCIYIQGVVVAVDKAKAGLSNVTHPVYIYLSAIELWGSVNSTRTNISCSYVITVEYPASMRQHDATDVVAAVPLLRSLSK